MFYLFNVLYAIDILYFSIYFSHRPPHAALTRTVQLTKDAVSTLVRNPSVAPAPPPPPPLHQAPPHLPHLGGQPSLL